MPERIYKLRWKLLPQQHYATAPDVAITSLESLKMTGMAVPGGNDTVTFMDGTSAYSVTAADSVLGIGTVWRDQS